MIFMLYDVGRRCVRHLPKKSGAIQSLSEGKFFLAFSSDAIPTYVHMTTKSFVLHICTQPLKRYIVDLRLVHMRQSGQTKAVKVLANEK
jgi:hypothetical protein